MMKAQSFCIYQFKEFFMETINWKSLFTVAFIFSSVSLFSQTSSPIIGYDKIAWGATIQVVSQNYPGIKEIKSEEASLGIREFEQSNISGSIDSRTFYFYQGKLYRVFVSYGQIAIDVVETLADRIVSIYGKFGDIDKRALADSNYAGKMYLCYRYYNKNLTIILKIGEEYNHYNYFIGNIAAIDYFDPIISVIPRLCRGYLTWRIL